MFKEAGQLVKNFVSLAAGVFLIRLLSMIANLYVARELGPSDFGVLSFGLELGLILSACANLGLDDLIVREVARQAEGAASLLGDALVLKNLAWPLGALAAIVLFLFNPGRGWLLALMVAYSLLYSYLLVFCAVFRGLERMQFQTLLMTGQMLLVAAGSILAVWLTRNVNVAALSYLLSAVLAVVAGYVLLNKKGIRPQYRWQPANWKRLLAVTLPFGLVFIYLLIHERLSTIVVAALCGEMASGWFNAVHSIILIITLFPSTIVATTFPLLSRKAQQGSQTVAAICANLVKYNTVVSLGLALLLCTAAPWAVPLLFGKAYQPSMQLLQIMAFGLPFLFINLTLISVLEAANQQGACARAIGYALIVAIPVCLAGTWWAGYRGGTLAYVANQAILAGVLLWLASNKVGRFNARQVFALPAVAGVVAGAMAGLGRHWSPLVLTAVVGGCYACVVLLISVLNPREAAMIRQLWRRKDKQAQSPPPPEPPLPTAAGDS